MSAADLAPSAHTPWKRAFGAGEECLAKQPAQPCFHMPDTAGEAASTEAKPAKKMVGVQDFEIQDQLGEGAFGQVCLCKLRSTGVQYAIKIIDKALCAGKDDMIEMELAVLK